MARLHGRKGRVYMGIADDSASAEPLPFVAKWSVSFTTDDDEVTALGDTNKVYVSGLPDASGDFSGFMDDSTKQTYTAAVDGLARKFYLYPSTLDTTKYFFGTILADFKGEGGVAEAEKFSAGWKAAGPVARQGF